MSVLTRIKNNQIQDSGIWANAKIIPGSIVGSLFNSNITVTSDFVITGNLTVQGSSTYLTVASTNTFVNDPLIVLNNAFTGSNSYDLGFVFNRGSDPNKAFYWDESSDEFRLITTTETGSTYGSIAAETNYEKLRLGNLVAQYDVSTITLTATGLINTTGNISGAVLNSGAINSTGLINTTGNISGAIINTGALNSTGFINTSGNISAATVIAGQFNTTGNLVASQVSTGTLNATGLINTTGNISGAVLNGGAINSTGLINTTANISAAIINTGALNSTGFINTTGNISGAVVNTGALNATGTTTLAAVNSTGLINTSGNISGAVINTGALNATGTTTLVDVNSTGFINTSGNVSAAVHTGGAVSVTGFINTTGNISGAVVNAGALNVTGTSTVAAINSTGLINTTGNVSAATVIAGQFNTTGNLSASQVSTATLNATGLINTLGNVSAATVIAGQFNTTGNLSATEVSTQTLKASGLTSGRVVFTGANGLLVDNAGITFAANTLTVGGANPVAIDGTAGSIGTTLANLILNTNYYVDLNSKNISNLLDPIDNQDAATKNYVDSQVSGITSDQIIVGDTEVSITDTGTNGTITAKADGATVAVITSSLADLKILTKVSDTTASTTTTSGAFQVVGGVGIGGNITVGGRLKSTDDTQSTSTTTGAIITAGGVGIAKNLTVGGDATITGNLNVQGVLTAIQSSTLEVNDLQVTLAKGAGSSAAADGAGINVDYGNVGANITYTHATTSWNFNRAVIGSTYANFGGNVLATNFVGGGVNISGNLLATTAVLNALTVNGGITSTGFFNTTANISAAVVNGGAINSTGFINTTGNISGAVVNAGALNVTGTTTLAAVNSTGFINTTGNISGAVVNAGAINSTGLINTTGNISAAVINTGALNSTGFINTSGNVSASQLIAATLSTRAAYGNIHLNQYASIFAEGNDGQNQSIVQVSTTGLSDGMGMWGFTGSNGRLFSSRGINFATGVTVRAQDTPTGGVGLVTITAAGDLWANATTPASNTTTGAFVVKGGVGIGGNLYAGAGIQNTAIGNVTAASGAFTTLSATGTTTLVDVNSTGFINTTGNISGAVINTGALNATGTTTLAAVNSTGFINTTANVSAAVINTGALNATGTTTLAAVNSTGFINTSGNVSAAVLNGGAINSTGLINTTGNISAATIIAGQFNTTGNLVASQVSTATLNATGFINTLGNVSAAVLNGGAINSSGLINTTGNISASRINADTLAATGTIWANAATDTSSLTTGALIVTGGTAVGKTLWVGEGAVINSTRAAEAFQVYGATGNNGLIYADTAKSAIVFSSAGNVTVQDGAIVKFDSAGAIVLPVGSNAQRPGAAGNVDVAGMLRFNNTSNGLEYFDGADWAVAGSEFTIIATNSFSGDGVQTVFTLSSSSTTAGTLVMINGVVQIPTTAYSVTGTSLTFTEAPSTGDAIDARVLTTTATVSAISSGNGYNNFDVATAPYANVTAGTSAATVRVSVDGVTGKVTFTNDVLINGSLTVLGDSNGNINIGNETGDRLQLRGKTVYDQTAINVPNTNLRELDSFSVSAFTTARYTVQVVNGGGVSAAELLVSHDDATSNIATYAVLSTIPGTFQSNISSGTVKLFYTPSGAQNANIKVLTTYIV